MSVTVSEGDSLLHHLNGINGISKVALNTTSLSVLFATLISLFFQWNLESFTL